MNDKDLRDLENQLDEIDAAMDQMKHIFDSIPSPNTSNDEQ